MMPTKKVKAKKPKPPAFFTGKRGPIQVTSLLGFDNTKKGKNYTGHKGFIVSWSQKGCGFGELAVFYNEKTKKLEANTECMGHEWVVQVLAALAKAVTVTG